MEWINVKDKLPEFIQGDDYSANVFAWCEGKLMVMAYCLIKDDNNEWCHAWCNCYGDIDGAAFFDDNYEPTHWMPLHESPE